MWYLQSVTRLSLLPATLPVQVDLFQRGIIAMSKLKPATAATAANKQVKKSLVSQLVATKAALGPYKKPSTWQRVVLLTAC